MIPDKPIELFSTCPALGGANHADYLQHVIDVARASDEAGCRGILVYTDNNQMDPWLVAQIIIQNTKTLCPLVAVQPIYMHPYTVAKMVTSLACLHGRRIYLNMVAGGFTNDLVALNDTTPHDRRYERLTEYTTIIARLLASPGPVSFAGEFYTVDKLRLSPPLPPALFPGIFLSGSSDGGLAAARALGATAIQYPKPAREYAPHALNKTIPYGIRVGVVTRERSEEAWAIAHARFPEDRRGQLAHQLAMKVSDSVWYKQLSGMGAPSDNNPYWLVPFQNYKTMCPYLVGSYQQVAGELAAYIAAGYRTFILDIPPDAEELRYTNVAFGLALEALA